ncbi:AMP-dependent synthetase/ligase [Pseudonocardia spinosispora]|uniref:AMP-dependent synthetase/ligase n=1 Tax=Pseudonocardia spinosispora TaxID=103441 RepID=UPI00040AD9B0|nr:long-chain fatty acid--CoA ligase [Pseudonocardia spinosispora]
MTGAGTLLDLIDRNAAEHPDLIATIDGDESLSWSGYRRRARAIALALLDLGVEPGEVVGLHMVNRAEHVHSDVGALYAGAVPASLHTTLAAEHLAYLAKDLAAVVAIVDADQLPLWLSIRGVLPDLRHLIVLDEDDPPSGVLRFDRLVDTAALEERGVEVDTATASVLPDNPITIVYTSGTTGQPKGTIITHAGVRFVMDGVVARAEEAGRPLPGPGCSGLSYVPLAHVAERMFSHYLACRQAATVTYVRDLGQLREMLPAVRPHFFLGVPRVWERIHSTIRQRAQSDPSPVTRALGRIALQVADTSGRATLARRAPDLRTRLGHPVLDRLVFGRIRAALGMDRLVMAASGSAPLSTEVLAFFTGIGITIAETYGMTETSAVLTSSPLGVPRPGTVGTPLPGMELRIGDDGEILARGPNITPGYLNRPEATAEAIDPDGWLHTGDLGELDSDGYLRITGRKKEMIISSEGRNISPVNVELALSGASDLLGPVYVSGDNRPYLVALLTLDPFGWQDWCANRGIPAATPDEAVAHPEVQAEAARAVEAGNRRLVGAEQVRGWIVLDHLWGSTTGELTPTVKLKRRVIAERYHSEVHRLYDDPASRGSQHAESGISARDEVPERPTQWAVAPDSRC